MVLGFGPKAPNFTEIRPIRPSPRQNQTGQNISAPFKFPARFIVQLQPMKVSPSVLTLKTYSRCLAFLQAAASSFVSYL